MSLPAAEPQGNGPSGLGTVNNGALMDYPYLSFRRIALHNLGKTPLFLAAIFCRDRNIKKPGSAI
jgi:hypothetical protein